MWRMDTNMPESQDCSTSRTDQAADFTDPIKWKEAMQAYDDARPVTLSHDEAVALAGFCRYLWIDYKYEPLRKLINRVDTWLEKQQK